MLVLDALLVMLLSSAGTPPAQPSLAEGLALIEARDFDRARDVLRAVVADEPKDHEARYRLGTLLAHSFREFDQAAAQFDAAVRLAPDDVRYRQALVENDETAEREYREAIAAAPGQSRPYGLLGSLLLRQERIDEAIEVLRKHVETAPEDPASHTGLGWAFLEKSRIAEAMKHFRKALSVDAQFTPAFYGIAQAYDKNDRLDEAAHMYRRYLAQAPDGPHAEEAQQRIKDLRR